MYRGNDMSEHSRSNLYIGLSLGIAALIAIFIWIPLDTETGLTERARRRILIGDALAPTIACGFIVVGALLLVLRERTAAAQPVIARSHVVFITRIMAVTVLGVLVMRYTGPALAELTNLFRAEPIEYRLLRATPGWKHVGFVLGGVITVAGMIAIVEQKLTRRAVLTALAAVLVMIGVFDLPFEDLLLPPNGDV